MLFRSKSFEGVDIALFSAGGSTSKKFAPFAVKSGCVVIDNSSAWRMLCRARRAVGQQAARVRLCQAAYDPSCLPGTSVDCLVFSYALSMFNPGYEAALDAARFHLRPGGLVAVVDFHETPHSWFRAWMGANHVRMDAQLAPALGDRFTLVHACVRPAYGGLWRYGYWLGRMR